MTKARMNDIAMARARVNQRVARHLRSHPGVTYSKVAAELGVSRWRVLMVAAGLGFALAPLLAAGLYWEWIVRKGRKYGAGLGSSYTEIRYEDLVEQPAKTLARLGSFLGHPGQRLVWRAILHDHVPGRPEIGARAAL